jgi:hypothetical protein
MSRRSYINTRKKKKTLNQLLMQKNDPLLKANKIVYHEPGMSDQDPGTHIQLP